MDEFYARNRVHMTFKEHCLEVYNLRYAELNEEKVWLLAFFLDPRYRKVCRILS